MEATGYTGLGGARVPLALLGVATRSRCRRRGVPGCASAVNVATNGKNTASVSTLRKAAATWSLPGARRYASELQANVGLTSCAADALVLPSLLLPARPTSPST